MKAILRPGRARYIAVALLSLAVITTTAFAFVHHSQAAQTPPASKIIRISGRAIPTVTPGGTVDISQLPRLSGSQAAALNGQPPLPVLSPLNNAQLQAYQRKVAAHQLVLPKSSMSPAPQAAPTAAELAQNATLGPDFDSLGYSALPPITHSFAGQSASGNGHFPDPDQATASNPSYIMEGNNNVISVYTFSGTRAYGPISTSTFFKPLLHSGDILS